MTTRTVVVGGGIMGAGIAYEARVAGFPVTIVESKPEFLEAAEQRVAHYEQRARSKGAELAGLRVARPDAPTSPTAAADADVVVEAVSEDLELKRSIFATVGLAAGDDAVLASNTSGLPIEVLGAASGRPGAGGRHALLQPGAGDAARRGGALGRDDATRPLGRALDFCHALGKETVEIRDLPGFVTTRLGHAADVRGDPRVRAGRRVGRAPRYRDEARVQPPDGPAGARRPGRPRHAARDPRRHARGVRRRVPRAAAAPPDGRGRASWAGRAARASTTTTDAWPTTVDAAQARGRGRGRSGSGTAGCIEIARRHRHLLPLRHAARRRSSGTAARRAAPREADRRRRAVPRDLPGAPHPAGVPRLAPVHLVLEHLLRDDPLRDAGRRARRDVPQVRRSATCAGATRCCSCSASG